MWALLKATDRDHNIWAYTRIVRTKRNMQRISVKFTASLLGRRDLEPYDDDLQIFEAQGAPPLPATTDAGYVDHDGARIWYSSHGSGPAVILLHGGLGHSGN